MLWPSPEIAFVAVSGVCALAFCGFALQIKSRKSGGRSAVGAAGSSSDVPSRPPKRQFSGGSTASTEISVRPSGILMCTPVRNTSAEESENFPPQNLPERKISRNEFPIETLPGVGPSSQGAKQGTSESARNERGPQLECDAPTPSVYARRDASPSFFENSDGAERTELPSNVTPINKFKKNASGSAASPENASEAQRAKPAAPQEQTAAAKLLKYFGLRQQPFDVTPDPAFLYASPSHREALASLRQGVEHFRGFMMLVGDPGMGKTMLLNKLMEELGDSARVVFLFQTQYNSGELLSFILDELEVEHARMDAVAMHRVLNQALLEEMLRGQRFVLIVDEAQNLQPPVLETIRLLSDFETTHSKLIQIVLAGQPKLSDTLMHPSLAQLRQRIASVSQLNRLSAQETTEYINHRMRAAGWTANIPFTRDALAHIAELSKGVPRTINNLCFNALLQTFLAEEYIADANMVRKAAEKMNLELPRHLSQNRLLPGNATHESLAATKRSLR